LYSVGELAAEPVEFHAKDFFIQKKQGKHRLILRRRRHVFVHRQIRRKSPDFVRAHLFRMPDIVKENILLSINTGLFRSKTVTASPHNVTDLIEKC